MTTPTRMTIRTAASVPTPAPIIVQVTVSAFCCVSVTRSVVAVVSIFGHAQSHSGYVAVLSVPGVGHSVLLASVLGHVQSHSRGGHVGLVLSGYVPGVGHSVLLTSELGHVQYLCGGGLVGHVQSLSGYVPGVGHSVLVLGHVQSQSGYVSGVGHSVLHTSVLGHVQSHSRGGHVVSPSTSVGIVAHCGVVGQTISSGCLSIKVEAEMWLLSYSSIMAIPTYSIQILHFCCTRKFCRFHAHNQLA